MTDHRSPEEIERQLEKDRAGLTDSLEDLRERFSLDGLIRQAADQFRDHGGDLSTSMTRAVKDNPMAVTLTGVGLAWLIFGDNRTDRSSATGETRQTRLTDRPDPSPVGTYGSRPQDRVAPRPMPGQANVPAWAHHDDWDGEDPAPLHSGATHDATGGTAGGTSGGASMASRMKDSATQASHSVRDQARRTGDAARDRATALRDRLSQGTESLSEEGRKRVIAARERAHEARLKSMDYANRGQERASDMFEKQPLIAGALALAIGAAIGAALPRTRFEDEHIGAQSDALIHEAERILAEERDKVGAVAGAAAQEARDVAEETRGKVEGAARQAKSDADAKASGQTAAQDVADRTKDKANEATQRVADAARDEAHRQDLGKPRT